MARTRQKRKAKQRQQQQQQATRRDATAKQQPTNPAEEAAIQTADALEAADELEEIADGREPAAEVVPQEQEQAEEPAERKRRAPVEPKAAGKEVVKEPRKESRRERKPAQEKRKEPRQRGRVTNFLIQVWAELRRVQWPDRNQVTQATGVVVVFCFLAGAFLAFWDFVFGELVTSIL
jgi:preprotein translocase subunit SecE